MLRSTPDKFGGLILMFGMILDVFLLDLILDDSTSDVLDDVESMDEGDIMAGMDSEIDDDDDVSALVILFFLGGKDIDEPYTDLASILSLLQFLDYFDLDLFEDEE